MQKNQKNRRKNGFIQISELFEDGINDIYWVVKALTLAIPKTAEDVQEAEATIN